MISRLIRLSIANRHLVVIIAVLLTIIGVYSLRETPVTLTTPSASDLWTWRGTGLRSSRRATPGMSWPKSSPPM